MDLKISLTFFTLSTLKQTVQKLPLSVCHDVSNKQVTNRNPPMWLHLAYPRPAGQVQEACRTSQVGENSTTTL